MAEEEPIREPENSTLDEWMGQRVARDEERVDRLLEESGGDVDEAAERFEEESDEGDEYRSQHDQS